MDFTLGEERLMIADSLRRYLQQRYPIETRNEISQSEQGWSSLHWSALAEMGIVGALFDEAAGGFGGSGFDIVAVFEQLGAALTVEPFLGTLMAGQVLADSEGQSDLIASVIAGEVMLCFAHEESAGRHDADWVATRAERDGDSWRLSGEKAVVAQLEAADKLVVSARLSGAEDAADGIGLFLVDRNAQGLSVRGYPMIDGGRGGELTLTQTSAILLSESGGDLLGKAKAAGVLALCWEAIGIMDVVKSMTVEYLRTRQQFGVPIGKFQALQHRMSTVALEIEQARSAGINAAAALNELSSIRDRAASAAKFTIGRVGTLVAEEAIQLHGGIGMTWELPLSHYAKRLTMIGHQLGDEDYHLARFSSLAAAA